MAKAVPIISAVTGVMGLIQNMRAQRDANNLNNRALDAQTRAQGMQMEAFETASSIQEQLEKMFQQHQAEGVYDADRRIEAVKRQLGDYEERDMGNTAGALATAGFKPGDSEIGVRLDSVKQKNQQTFADIVSQLIGQVAGEEMNALSMLRPDGMISAAGLGTSGAGQESQILMDMARQKMGQQTNPAGFLQMFMNQWMTQGQTPAMATPLPGVNPPPTSPVVTGLNWQPSEWDGFLDYSQVLKR